MLRLDGLAEYWLNPDEGIYYSTLTRASTREFWGEVMANAHPPLFYLILRTLGHVTWDFVWLRGTALVCGAASVWVLWLLGRELGGKGWPGVTAGLVAAGLLALNGEAIVFSQVLRPYTMLVALLGAALYHLLRYRSEPADRHLAAYVLFASLGLLTHYGAVLAFGAFLVVVAYYHLAKEVEPPSWNRLAVAQGIPAAVLVGLLLTHLGRSMGSYMMYLALAPDGWLSEWLVSSPGDAWHSFVSFQTLHLPVAFQGRAALLLLTSILASAVGRNRRDQLVAVLAGGALLIALAASYVGEYPFGPTRHNAWLVVFTLPALGWLVGHVVERGRMAVAAAAGAIAVGLIFGGFIESALGDYPPRGSAADERAVRSDEVRSLVMERLAPDAGPRIVLMSFQTFNLLMPLYARERQVVDAASPPDLFSFSYGSRDVVVSGRWDWEGWNDVREVVRTLPTRLPTVVPGRPDRVLLLAGGWDSSLFAGASGLEATSAVSNSASVTGRHSSGDRVTRLMAFDLDVGTLLGAQ